MSTAEVTTPIVPELAYPDGRALPGEADADRLPVPDRLHPDAATTS